MKLVWKSPLHKAGEDLALNTFDVFNKPIMLENRIHYFCSARDPNSKADPYLDQYVLAASFNTKTGEKKAARLKMLPKGRSLSIPAYWEVSQVNGEIMINTGKYINAFEIERYLTQSVVDGKIEWKRNERTRQYYASIIGYSEKGLAVISDSPVAEARVFNDAKSYTFGDHVVAIAKKSTRKLECRRNSDGKVCWTFVFVGYLYSKIEEKDGVIFFGTAGQGGHFYGLKLEDGSLLHDINTHGTVHFSWYYDAVCLIDSKGNLLVYNPATKATRYFELGNGLALHNEVNFLIQGDLLFAIVCQSIKKMEHEFDIFAVCIDLR